MKEVTLINGNGQPYNVPIPKLVYLTENINEVALNHIEKSTGLKFEHKGFISWEAQPINFKQITALFMTYDFKTEYHNDMLNKNIIFLKSLHNVGFKVDSICHRCCKKNGIYTNDLSENSMLMC